MRAQSASSSARSRAKTPDPVGRARTPGTPDTALSRRATPEGIRPRPASTEPGAIEGGAALRRAASATPVSRLKKPKVFCEEDFQKFLARQEQHRVSQAKHLVIPNGLIAGLRPTPLLPIMNGNGYVIQGAIYVEADWRSKPQQGDLLCTLRMIATSPCCLARRLRSSDRRSTCTAQRDLTKARLRLVTGKRPTWARTLQKGINSTTPVEPSWNAFFAKQKESLDRKKRRAASVPPTVVMPQVHSLLLQPSHDSVQHFCVRLVVTGLC